LQGESPCWFIAAARGRAAGREVTPHLSGANPGGGNRIALVRRERTPSTLRSAAVLALAALCLHQLVYLLSFGEHSGAALESNGHAYLGIAAPVLVALALCGIAASIAAARRARRPSGAAAGWLAWAALLLMIFVIQEAGEDLLRTGSLDQLGTLAASSGVAAVVSAMLIGRLVALALSGLSVLDATLVPEVRRRRAPARMPRPLAHSPLHFPRLTLAFGFARRPPPAPAG
jgi:hypothetical protein